MLSCPKYDSDFPLRAKLASQTAACLPTDCLTVNIYFTSELNISLNCETAGMHRENEW